MSSAPDVVSIMDAPRPKRPYQIIVLVDADTLKAIRKLQGTGSRKASRSEVGYRLLLAGLAHEERAQQAATDAENRRTGQDRRAAS